MLIKNKEKIGVVRIDDKLIKEVQEWLDENGNKYKHPTIAVFVNNAVYEDLSRAALIVSPDLGQFATDEVMDAYTHSSLETFIEYLKSYGSQNRASTTPDLPQRLSKNE